LGEQSNETRVYGYARVSTDDQELRHQMQALEEYGCTFVFEEKQSGKNMHRRQFEWLKKSLHPGDQLVVTKLDRLGRNLVELEQFLTWLEERGIELVCLHQPIDYKSANGRMMFRMMAAFAQMESELASERTKLGVAAAKAAGKIAGYVPKTAMSMLLPSDTNSPTSTAGISSSTSANSGTRAVLDIPGTTRLLSLVAGIAIAFFGLSGAVLLRRQILRKS